MDKQEANIDLLFRNGLKDYEVLPPREVWSNIRPLIGKHRRPVIFLRAAATIAAILSLSILTYRYSMQISSGLQDISVTADQKSDQPEIINTVADEASVKETLVDLPVIADASVQDNSSRNNTSGFGNVSSIQNFLYPELSTNSISQNNDKRSLNSNFPLINASGPVTVTENDNSFLYAPEDPAEETTQRWSVAALVSPTYYARFISGNSQFTSPLPEEEQAVMSYTGGVAFSYKINKRFSVQSGLYYSSFGQEIAGISSFGGFQKYDYTKGDNNFSVRTSNGIIYTNNADIFLRDNISNNRISTRYTNDVFDPSKANLTYLDNSLHQNFSYLELPVILRYKLVDRTIAFNIIGGVSSNVLVNNSVIAAMDDGSKYQIGKTDGLNFISFSSSLGMGMEYNFSDNLSLNLEPTFRYFINPITSIAGLRIHPYSFGIFSGLSYKF